MLLRIKSKLLFPIISRNISALYITGDKAKENYAILRPYFNFRQRLAEQESIQQNVTQRNLNINVEQLYQLWEVYSDVQVKKRNLELRRIEIANELKKITSSDSSNENLTRKYKTEGVLVREDLKLLKENSYHLEDTFIHEYLSLPNDLHQRTPAKTEHILYTHLENAAATPKNHLDHKDLIEYYDPSCYFLMSAAAEFDLELPNFCVDYFHNNDFIQFSNPDFCKSILVEAAGLQPEKIISVKDDTDTVDTVNKMHLIGGGSMISFLGFITKLSVFKSALPLKLVAIGREYTVQKEEDQQDGLYAVCQATQVQVFQVAADQLDAEQLFDNTLQHIQHIFKNFNEHFRIVYVPSNRLEQAECMRAEVEMYSTQMQRYVCVGHLSNYSDYISKRLLFNYKDSTAGKEVQFPHIIAGTIVNVPRILAILLEKNEKFEVPSFLR